MSYASFWVRFAAALVDGIILAIVNFLIGFVLGLISGGAEAAGLIASLAQLIIGWLYFAIQESSPNQATIGKQALGIYVTDLEGKRISFARATGRYFAKIISAIILLIGYIMAAFTEKRQALHDMIAGTLVVKR